MIDNESGSEELEELRALVPHGATVIFVRNKSDLKRSEGEGTSGVVWYSNLCLQSNQSRSARVF